jgi:hypothetical protein
VCFVLACVYFLLLKHMYHTNQFASHSTFCHGPKRERKFTHTYFFFIYWGYFCYWCAKPELSVLSYILNTHARQRLYTHITPISNRASNLRRCQSAPPGSWGLTARLTVTTGWDSDACDTDTVFFDNVRCVHIRVRTRAVRAR